MSYKFTLRDALLEAGARDYRDEPADKSWVPSDKLRKDMDKLIKKSGKGVSGTVIKAVAVAASVLLVSGVILTLKPVREAFSGTGDKTDTAPVTAPSTDGTAYYVPATQTTAAGERETESETSVAPPDAPPVTPDQTGVYLLLLGTEKDDEASGFLYAPEREAEVCGYCISVLTGSGASKELKNGAAHFLHGLKGFVSPLFATGNLIVRETVPEQSLTEGLSWLTTAGQIGASLGSLLGGVILDHIDAHAGVMMTWVYTAAAIPFALLGWWVFTRKNAER